MLSLMPESRRERIEKEASTRIPVCDRCTVELGKNKTCRRVLKDGNTCGGGITYLSRLDMAYEYEEKYERVPLAIDQKDLIGYIFPALKLFNSLPVTDMGQRTLYHQELQAIAVIYELDREELDYWEFILRDLLAAESFGASIGRKHSRKSPSVVGENPKLKPDICA